MSKCILEKRVVIAVWEIRREAGELWERSMRELMMRGTRNRLQIFWRKTQSSKELSMALK